MRPASMLVTRGLTFKSSASHPRESEEQDFIARAIVSEHETTVSTLSPSIERSGILGNESIGFLNLFRYHTRSVTC